MFISCVNMIKDWVAGCCLENGFVAQGLFFLKTINNHIFQWSSYPNLQCLKTQRMPKSVVFWVSLDPQR